MQAFVDWILPVFTVGVIIAVLTGLFTTTDGKRWTAAFMAPFFATWREIVAEMAPVLTTRTGRGGLMMAVALVAALLLGDFPRWLSIALLVVGALGFLLVFVGRRGASGPISTPRDGSPAAFVQGPSAPVQIPEVSRREIGGFV